MCKLSQVLSNYLHIFISNPTVGSVFEAHKWISSRVTAVPCFPTVMHLDTVTLLSNLEEFCSGLKTPENGKTDTLRLTVV